MPRKPPLDPVVYVALGRIIKTRRLARGLSQPQLGYAIGVCKMTISKYEAGKMAPTIEGLIRLAHACDLPLSTYLCPLDDIEAPARAERKGDHDYDD